METLTQQDQHIRSVLLSRQDSMNFELELRPVYVRPLYESERGRFIKGVSAVVRDDEPLGVVGSRYRLVQPSDVLETVRIAREVGAGEMVSTIVTDGGARQRVFVDGGDLDLPGIFEKDRHRAYLIFDNDCLGRSPFRAYSYIIREVCTNGLLAGSLGGHVFSIKHKGDTTLKLQQATTLIQRWETDLVTQAEVIRSLADKRLTRQQVQEFFLNVYLRMNPTIHPDQLVSPKTPLEERRQSKATEIIGKWSENWDNECQERHSQASAYTAVNAITEYVQHQRPVRQSKKPDRDVHNLLDGSAVNWEGAAVDIALALL